MLSQLLSKVGLNCHTLQVLHQLFSVSALMLDDATDKCFQLLLLRH